MNKLLCFFLTLVIFSLNFLPVFAEDLNSTNFKITGATMNSGGETSQAGSGNFKLLNTMGDFSGDPRVLSTNYRAGIGEVEIFTANVPQISCFETTTSGSSSCTTGPAYLNTNGMVRVCGPTGCYDRARFEIDSQSNPSDTLYAIQLSTDNFASDIRYIDGVTHKPITSSNVTIDDYLTKSAWETDATNVLGLDASTTYKLRAKALHGDFTESDPGPSATATTASATMSFDIDIADTTGVSTESSAPYTVNFNNSDRLVQTGPAQTSDDLIWLDGQTNGSGGLSILFKGQNGGLNSTTASYTITSASADLDGVVEGFGIQSYYKSQLYELGSGNGSLATLSVISPYNGAGNNVGIIDAVFSKVYESNGPTHTGRVGLLLKARASGSATPATDYTETVTIVIVPKY
ncbi:hypothetical protein IT417_03495 [bacterium]|nr:hypothetical protein [bacterium]